MNKLTAAAIAMGINGVTAASTEAELAAAVLKMQTSVASFTNAKLNDFVEALAEKVLYSRMYERVAFKNPLIKYFFKDGTQFHSSKEIFDAKLLKVDDFDPDKRMTDTQSKGKILSIILNEESKKQITNTIRLAGVRAAFASETAFSNWLESQLRIMEETLQVYMYEKLQVSIKDAVVNTINLPKDKYGSLEDVFVAATGIVKNMAIPSVKYNIGFADPTDAKNDDKVRKQISNINDLILIASPDVINSLDGLISTSKFHNKYFDTKKFGAVIPMQLDEGQMLIIDKKAFEGWFRVYQQSSQFWGKNLTTEHFLTFWWVFGMIPWANGFKLTFDKTITGIVNTQAL